MSKVIEVQVGEYRPVAFFDSNNVECNRGDVVIIEASKGAEMGRVVSEVALLKEDRKENLQGKVLRKATEGDWNQIHNNHQKAMDAVNVCIRKINDRKLDMRVVKAEYTFDCSKIMFFFTAEGRVDFRALVKDLAKVFRVRIELKQIRVRDKAKIVGGFGVCGRELCCSCYIKELYSSPIYMAKEQALPLNPLRISGVCDRIKCCMAYEFSVYKEFSRGLPHAGQKVSTPAGKGKVFDVNILKRTIMVDLGEGKVTKVVYPPPQFTMAPSKDQEKLKLDEEGDVAKDEK